MTRPPKKQPESVTEWIEFLLSRHTPTSDISISRFDSIRHQLALPTCPVITVVGTNGKGSTVKLIEQCFLNSGYRVGVYASPHVDSWNERIRLNGRDIDNMSFIQIFQVVYALCGELRLSLFDYLTLVALTFFSESQLDVVLLEAGLGGRCDAVNLVDADGVVITSVGLDHVDVLGGTREAIAREKMGVVRAGQWVVCNDLDPPAIVKSHCQFLGTRLYQSGRDYQWSNHPHESTWYFRGETEWCGLPLPKLLIENSAACLKVVELMKPTFNLSTQAVKNAIAFTSMDARFECWNHPVPCVFDSAHNYQATNRLRQELDSRFPQKKIIAVIGLKQGREVMDVVRPMCSAVCHWHVVDYSLQGGLSAESLASGLRSLGEESVSCCARVEEAVLCNGDDHNAVFVFFGSFLVVSDGRRVMRNWLEGGYAI